MLEEEEAVEDEKEKEEGLHSSNPKHDVSGSLP